MCKQCQDKNAAILTARLFCHTPCLKGTYLLETAMFLSHVLFTVGTQSVSVMFLLPFLLLTEATELPSCKESDYHFEYTDCDVLGSRWRVAIPNKPETCTGLPDPVKGTQCTFTCNEGEFLDMRTQECQKCVAGTYSLGTGVAFDEWDSLPTGFISHGINMNFGDTYTNCSNSTWIPKGDYVASNTDECTSTLSYAVSLKKPGSVSFQYFYPDSHMFFEFYVQNDQCQSTDTQRRWMRISESDWDNHYVQLSSGNNVLYWRTTGFTLAANTAKPVLLKNIAISGVSYTSECFHCKPGTYSDKPGAARCIPCAANSYSNKGATACQPCEADKYSGIGSGACLQRPPCKATDYFYTHIPCDSNGQTQLMYKWIEPKICSESVEEAVQLPASGEMVACPPCNPGFFPNNTSNCEPCPHGFYSNGTECFECPAGTEPVVGFEYKWWNKMPSNMKSSVFSSEYSSTERSTGWEVAGEYIYTTPSDQDSDYMLLTLTVPGYSLPHSLSEDNERVTLSSITFVFETKCTADCKLYFMAGQNERNNMIVESWSGTIGKQSYSYLIKSNNTVSFTWGFQRTGVFSMKNEYSSDLAKIYSVHLTNVIGGVASECRQCALAETDSCVPCPPGHYMLNGTGVCKSCPSNTIIRPEQPVGEEACIPCGPNTYSNEGRSACMSDCTLALHHKEETLHYNFSPLANVTGFQSSPRFTSKGLQYVHHFSVALCGTENRALASCVENVTESKRDVKGYICQSTVVPSEIRGQSVVSSQPFTIGDTLIGVTTKSKFDDISSLDGNFPVESELPDVIFYYRSRETTQACKNGRSTSIRLRCDPTVTGKDHISLPSNCSEGTCDGCSFHFLWRSQHACPLCSERNYKEIVSACIQGIQRTTYVWQQPLRCTGGVSLPSQQISACVTLDFWLKFGVSIGTVAAVLLITISCYFWKRTRKLQYKYSKLMMTAGDKECELPAADSCAIMEGEDAEDDLIYLSKKSFFTKIKSFSRERTSDGFDSVPLKSSAAQEMEMS
ncbi:endosome/lysosome-associated apoptosis and autophagy regulator 1 isoform X1 [Ctenopharyngodon idella]|uniref:endosome/lysosome-associated apoptosis and autophagy regulator 1 isoform X1 n=2 Tax=Ctenopharyngodon idella TaxID=7959 RepID=UPI00222F48F4|nr:endosome/lysosome-associated apoptosis and autophagy regulator 1 isoform X1 [Ctenopharyngodon idella]